jgi:hypothetical protein
MSIVTSLADGPVGLTGAGSEHAERMMIAQRTAALRVNFKSVMVRSLVAEMIGHKDGQFCLMQMSTRLIAP